MMTKNRGSRGKTIDFGRKSGDFACDISYNIS